MKIISASDTHVEGKTIRTFVVCTSKAMTQQARQHRLKVHTKYGVVDASILVEVDKVFAPLGKVLHVAHAHHREWTVWVAVR